MNGFDSYRVRERADVAQLVLVGHLRAAGRRVLPDPGHPAREVPAAGRDQPAPPDPAHRPRAARSSTGTATSSRRTSRATRSRSSRRRSTRCGPCSRRIGRFVPHRHGRRRGDRPPVPARRATSRRWCSATPPSRRSPGWRSIAPCCPGLVIQSEPKRLYPGRQGGGAPGGLRLPKSPSTTSTAERYPGRRPGHDRGQGGSGAAVRRHPSRHRRRALHGGERARAAGAGGRRRRVAAADRRAGRSTPRSTSTSSATSTASGRRACGAPWSR